MPKPQEAPDASVTPLRSPTAAEYQLNIAHWHGRATQLESENTKLKETVASLEADLRRRAADTNAVYDRLLDQQDRNISLQRRLAAILEAVQS
jgi:hypothetical protein